MNRTKKCPMCQLEKSTDQFYVDISSKTGLYGYCKLCCKLKRKQLEDINRKKISITNPTGTKICSICKQEKVVSEYIKNRHSKDGLLASCKKCQCLQQRLVRKTNKVKNEILSLDGEKRCSMCNKLKPKLEFNVNRCQHDGLFAYCKPCSKIMRTQYLKKDLRRFLLSSAKYRAKKKNLPFNIHKEDISIPDKCPVFSIPIRYSEGGKTDNSPTIDRIDNTKGYIKGNIVVVSFKANRIKSNATLEELQNLVNFYTQQKG